MLNRKPLRYGDTVHTGGCPSLPPLGPLWLDFCISTFLDMNLNLTPSKTKRLIRELILDPDNCTPRHLTAFQREWNEQHVPPHFSTLWEIMHAVDDCRRAIVGEGNLSQIEEYRTGDETPEDDASGDAEEEEPHPAQPPAGGRWCGRREIYLRHRRLYKFFGKFYIFP